MNQAAASYRERLIGSWRFASDANRTGNEDSPAIRYFGARPNGTFIFLPNGRYSVILMHPELPRFKANDRLKGTPEENMAVIRGVYAHFGTFIVDEAKGQFVMRVEGSTFPNDVGTDTVRKITILTGDTLEFTNDSPPTGEAGTKAYVLLERAD
jgi:Lipocalin-like domain